MFEGSAFMSNNDILKPGRRQVLGKLGSLSMLALFGCGGGEESAGASTAPAASAAGAGTAAPAANAAADTAAAATPASSTGVAQTAAGSCTLIPTETEGPYPLLAILGNSAMVRRDITEGKTGVPLTLVLNLRNVGSTCAPISNAAVYVWHCDKDGGYSGYSSNANGNHQGETFLRGIQVSDSAGQVTFTTIYPGWYAGRITHIHFQVYLNDNLRVTATATSQLGFPQSVTEAVYASSLYSTHGQNSSVRGFAADNVFSDGTEYQIASVTGDVNSEFVATLDVGIRA
jgi:protocatechuate 3,4-dioxygenase beta subunit